MRRFTAISSVLVALVLAVGPSAAAPADNPVNTATLFEQAGFKLLGEMPGFAAYARPAKTKLGIIVPGRLTDKPDNPFDGPAAVWRVNDQEVDLAASPKKGPGGSKPWGTFGNPNHAGWFVGSTHENRQRQGNALAYAYVLTDTDELIYINAPSHDQIEPRDINDAGQVVGWYSPPSGWAAFVWSREEGFTDLGEVGVKYMQVTGINSQGMIVGHGYKDELYRPRLWMPPAMPGEERVVRTLEAPEGFDDGWASGVNDRGTVLIRAAKRIGDKSSPLHYRHVDSPFIWTQDQGFAALPRPDVVSATPLAITNTGEVLLSCWGTPGDAVHHPRNRTFYLCHEGQAIKLPAYPGAVKTQYRYMSDEGLIAGTARFDANAAKDQDHAVSFVITLNDVDDD